MPRASCPRSSTALRAPRGRRGAVLVYASFVVVLFAALAMLAVDYGRQTVARGELQAAADAAARYAAVGMVASSTKSATAYSQASLAVADARADGRAIALTTADVEVGVWTASTRKFVASNSSGINAVRVTVTTTLGGTGSLPLFSQMFGQPGRPVRATSIATAAAVSTTVTAPSQGNLWLSGAADNTTITNNQGNTSKYDNSGTSITAKQRPMMVDLDDLGLKPGDTVSFEGLAGTGNNGSGASDTGPDGNLGCMVSLGGVDTTAVPATGANGIANTRAPLAACMAIFMNDKNPSAGTQPAGLDFGTAASRDYKLLAPLNKQPFFVGDGKTSLGEVQKIRVPAGAKRLFLGMMDAWQWNDNSGSFSLKFYRSTTVSTVR